MTAGAGSGRTKIVLEHGASENPKEVPSPSRRARSKSSSGAGNVESGRPSAATSGATTGAARTRTATTPISVAGSTGGAASTRRTSSASRAKLAFSRPASHPPSCGLRRAHSFFKDACEEPRTSSAKHDARKADRAQFPPLDMRPSGGSGACFMKHVCNHRNLKIR